MKIKFRKSVNTVTTITSPYPNEIGKHTYESITACCGNCGKSVQQAYFYKSWNYCPYCGEKIDWEKDK